MKNVFKYKKKGKVYAKNSNLPNRYGIVNLEITGILSPSAVVVYIGLLGFLDGNSAVCYPSLDLLADRCNMSRKTVSSATLELIEKDFIERKQEKLDQGGMRYKYRISRFLEIERIRMRETQRYRNQVEN